MTSWGADSLSTPDYYQYPWTALASARLTEHHTVEVGWPDGAALECHPMWLRENAPGPGGINAETRECELDPAHLPADLKLGNVGVDGGALAVVFEPEGRAAQFHPGWLRHVAEGQEQPFAFVPAATPWTASGQAGPVTHDGRAVLDDARVIGETVACGSCGADDDVDSYAALYRDRDALRAALCDLSRYGLVRLEGCGTDPRVVAEVANSIGAIRDTNFGLTWHVDVDVDPTTVANTGLRLPPHSDLPTREVPPGLQLLHCVENSVVGGYSTMADGLAVAEHLRVDEPEAFEALTTLEWVFFNRSRHHDHRWRGPIIDLGDGRLPYTFRAFHPVRAFPAMEPDDVDRAYEALRCFSAVAGSERFQLRYPFRPGDIVIFDNRRILHGRESFEPQPGTRRRLIGAYIDTDEFYSRLRVLLRHAAAGERSPAHA